MTGLVFVVFALVAVTVIAYRLGYVRGQDELRPWHGSTAAEGDALRMTPILPRWRHLTGLAAYGFAGLLNCLFLGLGFLYFKRWGWAVTLSAWMFWLALFVGVIWLAEWCWQPSREGQERLRQKQNEILRALEGRAKQEDQA